VKNASISILSLSIIVSKVAKKLNDYKEYMIEFTGLSKKLTNPTDWNNPGWNGRRLHSAALSDSTGCGGSKNYHIF